MKIKDVDKVCVVDIAGNAISKQDLIELKKLFNQKALKKRIGINLKNILEIDNEFLEFLEESGKKRKLSVYNVNNDVYLMLFVLRYEQYVDIYLNEEDFFSDKNCIVYRRLKLLPKSA